ncbi:hypothetical protein ACFVWG_24045 [Kribbella sp. NPDC058245]|uniref:hypothetical protein n=1 Tax=Kribbella sp. NPDC058245 TaxID=3346399 RepID=UPI0036EA01E6
MADTLTANLFPATTRVSVSLSWTSDPVPATATVERVNADGTVIPVRGADPATLVAGAWIGDDYEAPLDLSFYYQATSTDRPGVVVTSETYEMDSAGRTWLKHPGRPFLNTVVEVAGPPDLTRPVAQGVFEVLGRSRPVAVTMRRNSERGELVLNTRTDTERVALVGLLDDGGPLFLAAPGGYGLGSVYIAVGEVTERRLTGLGATQDRQFVLPFTVVDRPIGTALALGNSWSDVYGAYASWSQLLATEGTWTGVLEGVS